MAAKTVRHTIILDEGEPFWILRGNSPLAPQLTQIWAGAAKLIDANAHAEKIKDAYIAAAEMRAYLKAHGREEFPILAAIEQSIMLPDEDASPLVSKETH